MAVVTFAGALAAIDGHLPPVPLVLAISVLAAGWAAGRAGRRPEILCLGAALLAAALAQRSLAGLEAPLDTGAVRGEVELVADPVPDGRGGVTVDVRHDGRRLRGVARSAAAAALDDRLAGERVTVIGAVEPPGRAESWLRHRHIAGRLRIDTVTGWRPSDPASRLANGLRRTLARGAEHLPERQRSLLAGVTLGDDRAQPADMTDAFRAAGLTHLLAVSGQNVAFVLVIAAPVLTRLRFGPRLVATLGVLVLFALVTRAEPSVLRATAMASVAAVGAALGRPASAVRTLALGVTGMVLVDPLLVTSVGFRLSVAGAGGLIVGASRLERAIPGPRWVSAPLSVTLAAQAAVSPLLVTTFGSVPVASLPANLLAAPAAGPLMVWGLTGGMVAGIVGGPVAQVLHLPTRLLLTWLDGVAIAASRWPLGDLRAGHLAVLGGGALALAAAGSLHRRRRGVLGRALGAAGCVAVVAPVLAASAAVGAAGPGPAERALGAGATLWRSGGAAVVVLDGRARGEVVLSGLRREGVARVDVVVLRTGARAAGDVAALLRRRWPAAALLAPATDGRSGAGADRAGSGPHVSPPTGTVIDIGGLRLAVTGNRAGRLEVQISVLDDSHRPRPPPEPVPTRRSRLDPRRCARPPRSPEQLVGDSRASLRC